MTEQPSPDAIKEAARELIARGFTPIQGVDTAWSGFIEQAGGEDRHLVRVRVQLLVNFPHALPVVTLKRPDEHPWYAHIEHDGKICTAPPADYLLDSSRPAAIIRDVLDRALKAIFPASQEAHDSDLLNEFSAYWPSDPKTKAIRSIVPSSGGNSGEIFHSENRSRRYGLFAASVSAASQFSLRTGTRLEGGTQAYHIVLNSLFLPPRFRQNLTLRELRVILQKNCDQDDFARLDSWIAQVGVPLIILASAPLPQGGAVQFAARSVPSKRSVARYRNFRPATRKARYLQEARDEPLVRVGVDRMDDAYIVERGGGNVALLEKRVAVLGCGSVGSHLALALAGVGIGHLILVDDETLSTANIHRHVLGAADVGLPKTNALAGLISHNYPNMTVTACQQKVEDALRQLEDKVDLIMISLGDETLELRLNDELLPLDFLRLHVWLEPLGLGGHVLACGVPTSPGCLHCLYRADPSHGLVCQASLVEPGQRFQRTLAGCAGTFTPYGILDAQRAAIEACREGIRLLTSANPDPMLRSWVTSKSGFADGKFFLSQRGRGLLEGQTQVTRQFARRDCPVCGGVRR